MGTASFGGSWTRKIDDGRWADGGRQAGAAAASYAHVQAGGNCTGGTISLSACMVGSPSVGSIVQLLEYTPNTMWSGIVDGCN